MPSIQKVNDSGKKKLMAKMEIDQYFKGAKCKPVITSPLRPCLEGRETKRRRAIKCEEESDNF